MGSGQHGLGLLGLDPGTAERKGEFVPATHGQNGVEQSSGGKNVHGGYTKIGFQGLVGRLSDDPRMTDGVGTPTGKGRSHPHSVSLHCPQPRHA